MATKGGEVSWSRDAGHPPSGPLALPESLTAHPPRRSLSGTSSEGLGLLRAQTRSPCIPKPWRRCGATFCPAGAPASACLVRTLSVSTVPGGPPVSTQRLALLFSLCAVSSLLRSSSLEPPAALLTFLEPAGVSERPASSLPVAGRSGGGGYLPHAGWEEALLDAYYLPAVSL